VSATRRVAVTGLGAVTPVGNDVPATWRALTAGRSGIGAITTFPSETYPIRIAGMVKDLDVSARTGGRVPPRHLSRAAGFGIAAAVEALEDAGVSAGTYRAEERGVAMGSTVGRLEPDELAEMMHVMSASGGARLLRASPASVVRRDQNTPMAAMAVLAGCQGPLIGVSTACAGSAHALGEAFRCIQEGDARMMLAGGYDALTTCIDVLGFALLGALTSDHGDEPHRASRPFDRERSGFVLGEGAVVAVLEEWGGARARGARIYAELRGYGSSLNAYRITDSPPDGGGAVLAMARALRESGLRAEEIDCVVAHGTSTPGNDLSETAAIKAVFGEHARRLAVTAPKSMTGHLTSAAGSLNLLVAACAIRDGLVPPTINQERPDPKLDLDYVPNVARPMPLRAAMVNAFAFGGTNACLVVARPGPASEAA
jgi:3-oxoacyl-[acyl-carrier-protein] synthase II